MASSITEVFHKGSLKDENFEKYSGMEDSLISYANSGYSITDNALSVISGDLLDSSLLVPACQRRRMLKEKEKQI